MLALFHCFEDKLEHIDMWLRVGLILNQMNFASKAGRIADVAEQDIIDYHSA